MRSWTIAFATGVVLASQLPALPAFTASLAVLLIALLLHRFRLRLLASAGLGAVWLCLYAGHALEERWPQPPFPRDVWVEATVWGLPVATRDGQRLPVRLDKICLSSTLSLCDFSQLRDDGRLAQISVYEPVILKPGQHWRWLLRLKPPHGFVNPGGFDYEAWLLQQRISATGYLRSDTDNKLLVESTAHQRLQQWRFQLEQTLATPQAVVLQRPDLLRALTIGDGSAIPDADWQLFAATGTTHLLVISGSHVALVMWLLYSVSRWLFARSSTLLLWIPANVPAAVVAIAGSWAYTGIAGFSLPALRAWWMVAVLLLAQLWRRQLDSWHSLGLALLAVLLGDPLAVLNAGCWLSFAAVAVLLHHVGAPTIPWWLPRHWPLLLWQLLKLQMKLAIALLPIVLVAFQQTSVIAPLINLPLVPLLGLTVPLALAGVLVSLVSPTCGLWLLQAADFLLELALRLLHFSMTLVPHSLLTLPALSLPGQLSLLVACLTAVFAAHRWQRWLALGSLPLTLWVLRLPALPSGTLQVQVLDVGQGLAIAVHTTNHHLLYDAGPVFSEGFDAGSDVVLPVLRAANVHALDHVMISHADRDHAGGLPALVQAFPEAAFSSSAPWLFPRSSRHWACRAGQHWQWDGVEFAVLHPDNSPYSDNDGSCVLQLTAAGRRILLTGDIEKPAEQLLMQRYPALHADILVVPHHGSNSSSTAAFIRQVQPLIAVYSAGYLNRFHHPAAAVQARYQQAGVLEYLTAEAGAVTLTISANGQLAVAGERQLRPHFWHLFRHPYWPGAEGPGG